jgi:plasmid stabilization system protein ParE
MTNVEQLCADWLAAKSAETAANKSRIAIEDQIAQALDAPQEGSKTHNLDKYKVTLSQPVTRKLDADIWAKVSHLVPESMRPIKVKIEADATGCKYLANNEPETWAKIAQAFETKPGKIGVKVEAV